MNQGRYLRRRIRSGDLHGALGRLRPSSVLAGSASILGTLLYRASRHRPRAVHRDDAAARRRGRSAQRDLRQPDDEHDRGRDRHADRHHGGHLSRRIRHATARLAFVVRFVNDILLSAPSIVLGLFIYDVMVLPMGHFSAWAGAVALAFIVMPVVVRTTENMLLLVPNTLREAGARARRAAVEGDPQVTCRAAQRGHRHRRAAGDRAHLRRDRAAAVHRAQQPVLERRSQRADGEPAGRRSSSSR